MFVVALTFIVTISTAFSMLCFIAAGLEAILSTPENIMMWLKIGGGSAFISYVLGGLFLW